MNDQTSITLERLGIKVKETTLSLGSRLIFFEKPDAPLFLQATFNSGSRFDPRGKEGTAHFTEHMILAGSKNFPTKDKLSAYIEQFGGRYNAFTNNQELCELVEIGDPNDYLHAARVFSETLINPLFLHKTIESERGSILRELGERKANPTEMLWEVYRRLFYQDTDLGRSTLGTEESIKSITKEDLINFYHSMITSGRCLFVGCGGIETETIKKALENSIHLPLSEKFVLEKNANKIRNKVISIENYPTEQIYFFLGFRTCSLLDKDRPVLNLIATLLGGGTASTLTNKLRYERGLVYSVSANCNYLADAGTWHIKTSVDKSKFNESLKIITEEFSRVRFGGISKEELEFVKNKIIKTQRVQMQTSRSFVEFHYSDNLLKQNSLWTIENYLQEINNISQEDLKNVGEKYFRPDNWYLAICGDITEDKIKIDF